MLAGVAAVSRRPRTVFWTLAVAGCAVASLGSYTPIYPLLRDLVPPLRTFRFPVKYLSLSAFGIAALAAFAFDRSRTDAWRVAPATDVREALVRVGNITAGTQPDAAAAVTT